MQIVCSNEVTFGKEAFSTLGDVLTIDGRGICNHHLKNAEILIVRSTTKVNRKLLETTPVRFVGTATIGIDHIDIDYLDSMNIKWCYASGCNSNSVAEYVISAILYLACKYNLSIRNKTLGIIGVGNVGSKVFHKAKALGMKVLLNDPPRERIEGNKFYQFVSLDTLLAESDIVTFHVPLTKKGPDATLYMASKSFFNKMKKGAIIINSSRGQIVDKTALMEAIKSEKISYTVIDTWENEPDIDIELLKLVDIATPHIAGYSFDGKVKGTEMVYNQVCEFLNVKPVWKPIYEDKCEVTINVLQKDCFEKTLYSTIKQVYDIEEDSSALKQIINKPPSERIYYFDYLRKNYRTRYEFSHFKCHSDNPEITEVLEKLGFNILK